MKILLTGCTGFIGSSIAKTLLADNHEIHAAIRPNSDLWRILDVKDELNIHYMELNSVDKIREVLEKNRIDTVVHTVGVVRGFSLKDQENVIDYNFQLTVNVLNAAALSPNVNLFINTGTSREYGSDESPLLETKQEEPNDLYSLSKLAGTYYTRIIGKSNNLTTVTLRIFTPYGPFDSLPKLIPYVIVNSMTKSPIFINTPYSRRDYIHVADIALAYSLILKSYQNIEKGDVFNIGSGKCTTTADLTSMITDIMGTRNLVKMNNEQIINDKHFSLCSSNEKAKQKLKWIPKYPLKDGIKNTVDWYVENLEKFESRYK